MSFGDDTLDPNNGKCCGARKITTEEFGKKLTEAMADLQPATLPNPATFLPTPETIAAKIRPPAPNPYDPVNRPRHYNKGKIEVADFIKDQNLNFDRGNAVKYICRAGDKEDPAMTLAEKTVQDLEKAIWYIKHEIEGIKKNGLSG